jgi:hypothetical protein
LGKQQNGKDEHPKSHSKERYDTYLFLVCHSADQSSFKVYRH